MSTIRRYSSVTVVTASMLLGAANTAVAYETQADCEGAGGTWDTTKTTCTIEAEGAAVTMVVNNPQTISVVTLTKKTAATDVTAGSDTYYASDIPAEANPAAWGVKTNGRFSMSIANDFGSIMDDKGTTETTDDVAMFGATPTITDDFGTTVTWPAFVKWETDAAGKKYDGVEITGTKRYEVLPADFGIDVFNVDSTSGSLTTVASGAPTGFKEVNWNGTGKQVIGLDTTDGNNFATRVGSIQVADKLGASGTNGAAGTVAYTWTDDDNVSQNAKIADHLVGVFVFPDMDQAAAANAQAGTYYAAIKLTVTAQEGGA